jgi:hypothetical protein
LIAHEILFKPQIYDYLSSAAICAWTEGYRTTAAMLLMMKITTTCPNIAKPHVSG